MNNYIDERLIPYRRHTMTANRVIRREKGRPLARNTRKHGLFMGIIKAVAFIFLLLLSTFGGDESVGNRNGESVAEKAIKKCLYYTGVLLALWGFLVVMSKVTSAFTFLPLWSLIAVFALTLLGAAGVLKK